jgi:hypothetical protein
VTPSRGRRDGSCLVLENEVYTSSMTLDSSLGIVAIVAIVALIAQTAVNRRRPFRPSARATAPNALSDLDAALARLEVALDAIAVEVERIGEGQRYLTRMLADRTRPSDPP